MEQAKIQNAIIKAASITSSDHGILTAWVTLSYGASGQSFGGYSLYLPKGFGHHNINGPAGHFIFRVMEIAGVTDWSSVVGKSVRALATHSGVEAIGHIIKEDWFNPSQDFSN